MTNLQLTGFHAACIIISLSSCLCVLFFPLSSYLFIAIGPHKISLIILSDTFISINTLFMKLSLKRKKREPNLNVLFYTMDSKKQALMWETGNASSSFVCWNIPHRVLVSLSVKSNSYFGRLLSSMILWISVWPCYYIKKIITDIKTKSLA